ncbi:MAG TPA: iron ABC transporter permease [archaeon]|nr:iron ABC transporter permease [archaeon]
MRPEGMTRHSVVGFPGWRARAWLCEPATLAVGLALGGLLTVFVLLPVLQVIIYPPIHDYFHLTENSRWVRATSNTFRMVLLSTCTSTLVGFLYAMALSRPDFPGRGFFRLTAILPLFSPPFTIGFSYLLMFGCFGVITHSLFGLETSILGWWSLWVVQTLSNFPYAALAIERALAATPPTLEAAANDLGGGWGAVFRTITLPLARPAVAGAALLVAIYVLADFANPLIIGGDFPLLATEAWYRIDGWGDLRGATLLAATLLPPALLLFIAERYWVSRRSYAVIGGRGSSLDRPPLPGPLQWGLLAFCGLIAALTLTLYFGVVAGAFTQTWGVDWTPTLAQWDVALTKTDHIRNSLVFAATAGLLATVLATVGAHLIDQKAFPAVRALDALYVLPAAVPGVFFGIGYLLLFNRPGIPLAGTASVLILAFTFHNLPFSYQVARAGLAQVHQNLAEAAADLGAFRFRILWDVHLRLIFPACVAAWTTAFVSSVTNVSIAVFLVSGGNQVATFSILGLIGDNRLEAASAVTTALMLVTLIVIAAAWRFSRGARVIPGVLSG